MRQPKAPEDLREEAPEDPRMAEHPLSGRRIRANEAPEDLWANEAPEDLWTNEALEDLQGVNLPQECRHAVLFLLQVVMLLLKLITVISAMIL